jgi:hypothetical protein
MLYLDDRLPTHPKILKAGARLGEGGASMALHLFVLGISYARQNMTDGFIPRQFVSSCGVVSKSGLVANALSARGIGLWRKVRGGFVIHDYHHWNPKASVVKQKREQDRQRKALERAGRNGNLSTMDTPRTRARAFLKTTYHSKSTSTGTVCRLADARQKRQDAEKPSFALACVVMRDALQRSWHLDHDGTLSNVGEHFKQICAQRGLAYDADLVRKAYEAVTVMQRRRA